MKILYVEDELSQNIERILQLFGPTILSEKQRKELKDLQNDDYGAASREIRDIITRSGVLDVETDFLTALQRIEHEGEKYDLFIVDRQLATDADAYKWKDVAAIASAYTNKEFEKYLTREGDYLFMRLMRQGSMAKCHMFYFLTAYTESIKCQDDLRPFMEAGWFKDEQVLEKGNIDHLRRLCEVISQSTFLSVRYKYLSYFEKVEALDSSAVTLNKLVKLFEAQEQCTKANRGAILADARGLLEIIVGRLCIMNKVPNSDSCRDNLQALSPYASKVISHSILSLGLNAYTLCSNYGVHPDPDVKHPLLDVPDDIFQCALYAIRAFITKCQDPNDPR